MSSNPPGYPYLAPLGATPEEIGEFKRKRNEELRENDSVELQRAREKQRQIQEKQKTSKEMIGRFVTSYLEDRLASGKFSEGMPLTNLYAFSDVQKELDEIAEVQPLLRNRFFLDALRECPTLSLTKTGNDIPLAAQSVKLKRGGKSAGRVQNKKLWMVCPRSLALGHCREAHCVYAHSASEWSGKDRKKERYCEDHYRHILYGDFPCPRRHFCHHAHHPGELDSCGQHPVSEPTRENRLVESRRPSATVEFEPGKYWPPEYFLQHLCAHLRRKKRAVCVRMVRSGKCGLRDCGFIHHPSEVDAELKFFRALRLSWCPRTGWPFGCPFGPQWCTHPHRDAPLCDHSVLSWAIKKAADGSVALLKEDIKILQDCVDEHTMVACTGLSLTDKTPGMMSVALTWLERLIDVESDKLSFEYRVREMLAMEIGLRLGVLYEVCIRLFQRHGAVPDLQGFFDRTAHRLSFPSHSQRMLRRMRGSIPQEDTGLAFEGVEADPDGDDQDVSGHVPRTLSFEDGEDQFADDAAEWKLPRIFHVSLKLSKWLQRDTVALSLDSLKRALSSHYQSFKLGTLNRNAEAQALIKRAETLSDLASSSKGPSLFSSSSRSSEHYLLHEEESWIPQEKPRRGGEEKEKDTILTVPERPPPSLRKDHRDLTQMFPSLRKPQLAPPPLKDVRDKAVCNFSNDLGSKLDPLEFFFDRLDTGRFPSVERGSERARLDWCEALKREGWWGVLDSDDSFTHSVGSDEDKRSVLMQEAQLRIPQIPGLPTVLCGLKEREMLFLYGCVLEGADYLRLGMEYVRRERQKLVEWGWGFGVEWPRSFHGFPDLSFLFVLFASTSKIPVIKQIGRVQRRVEFCRHVQEPPIGLGVGVGGLMERIEMHEEARRGMVGGTWEDIFHKAAFHPAVRTLALKAQVTSPHCSEDAIKFLSFGMATSPLEPLWGDEEGKSSVFFAYDSTVLLLLLKIVRGVWDADMELKMQTEEEGMQLEVFERWFASAARTREGLTLLHYVVRKGSDIYRFQDELLLRVGTHLRVRKEELMEWEKGLDKKEKEGPSAVPLTRARRLRDALDATLMRMDRRHEDGRMVEGKLVEAMTKQRAEARKVAKSTDRRFLEEKLSREVAMAMVDATNGDNETPIQFARRLGESALGCLESLKNVKKSKRGYESAPLVVSRGGGGGHGGGRCSPGVQTHGSKQDSSPVGGAAESGASTDAASSDVLLHLPWTSVVELPDGQGDSKEESREGGGSNVEAETSLHDHRGDGGDGRDEPQQVPQTGSHPPAETGDLTGDSQSPMHPSTAAPSQSPPESPETQETAQLLQSDSPTDSCAVPPSL